MTNITMAKKNSRIFFDEKFAFVKFFQHYLLTFLEIVQWTPIFSLSTMFSLNSLKLATILLVFINGISILYFTFFTIQWIYYTMDLLYNGFTIQWIYYTMDLLFIAFRIV